MYGDSLDDTILNAFLTEIQNEKNDLTVKILLIIANIGFLLCSTTSIPLVFYTLKQNFFSTYYANNASAAAQSLLSLINDILDFSKLESDKMELVEEVYQLDDLIRNLVSMIRKRREPLLPHRRGPEFQQGCCRNPHRCR